MKAKCSLMRGLLKRLRARKPRTPARIEFPVRPASRFLFALSALCMAAGSFVHALAFPKAAGVVSRSNLPYFFAAAFKGLWLSDSASLFTLALVFSFIAMRPHSATRPLAVLLGLVPLASALSIYSTIGNFFAGHVLLLASGAALLAGALRQEILPAV